MRAPYRPGEARMGEPTPQTDPDLFTVAEIRAEIRYLARLDKRYGVGVGLRLAARLRLMNELLERSATDVAPATVEV